MRRLLAALTLLSAARNEILRRVQLEQENFTRLQRLKGGAGRRAPEVHFFDVGIGRVQREPIAIRHSNIQTHPVGQFTANNPVVVARFSPTAWHYGFMAYEDVERLRPCAACGSLPYWFDGRDWRCDECEPSALEVADPGRARDPIQQEADEFCLFKLFAKVSLRLLHHRCVFAEVLNHYACSPVQSINVQVQDLPARVGLNRWVKRGSGREFQPFDQILWKAVTLANSTFFPADPELMGQGVSKEFIEQFGRASRIATPLSSPRIVGSQQFPVPIP
jgi:hypothetical protein